jgi:hypothetical protein
VGNGASATGPGAIAIGDGATATGSIALGAGASAANGGAAYGDGSTATGTNSTAIGPNATATFANSAAFGSGATSLLADEQVFGTGSNTYRMPGLTTALSQARQSGRLAVVMTDADGNIAGDGGSLLQAVANIQGGAAIALAAEAPSLVQGERFGVRMGWGNFDGVADAFSTSAIGVLCSDCLADGDRIAIDAAIGIGWSEYESYVSETVGGRAGMQLTW